MQKFKLGFNDLLDYETIQNYMNTTDDTKEDNKMLQ